MTPTATASETSKLYIGGAWTEPASDETIDVINPATEQVMGQVPAGTAADVDAAVAAASGALESWSALEPADRAGICTAIGARLQDRAEEIAALVSQELGSPITEAVMIQAGLPAISFTSMEHLYEHLPWEQTLSLIHI